MDGVVADFEKKINELLPTLHTDYSTEEEKHEVVEQMCRLNKGIFSELELIPGASESIWQLNELYDLYFLSTPMWCVPQSFTDKRFWLEKHFGKLAEKKLILTHRKDLNIGSFLVDDRIKHGVDKFTGLHIHFGTAEYPTWKEVTKYLVNNAAQFAVKCTVGVPLRCIDYEIVIK